MWTAELIRSIYKGLIAESCLKKITDCRVPHRELSCATTVHFCGNLFCRINSEVSLTVQAPHAQTKPPTRETARDLRLLSIPLQTVTAPVTYHCAALRKKNQLPAIQSSI